MAKIKEEEDNINPNTLTLPSGLVRLICGLYYSIMGLILASMLAPEANVLLHFGLGGEFLGLSLPGIANYFK